MRTMVIYIASILALLGALGGGIFMGFKIGSRTTMTSDMTALAFAGEHAKLAFDQAPAPEASEALVRYRSLVEKVGKDAVGAWGTDYDLMLTNARLAAVARELGRSDTGPMASAVAACQRLSFRDCSPARLTVVAGTRRALAPKGDGGTEAGSEK